MKLLNFEKLASATDAHYGNVELYFDENSFEYFIEGEHIKPLAVFDLCASAVINLFKTGTCDLDLLMKEGLIA